jgi:hypothetical protein
MKIKFAHLLCVIIFLSGSFSALAQKKQPYDLAKLFQKGKLVTYHRNVSVSDDKEHKAIKLDESDGEGIVWLKNVRFSAGTITLDLKGKDVLQQSFIGTAFHGVNDSTYDAVYFRPFNFHATDPIRKIHAVQYVSHPEFPWNRLREERNGVFEKALATPPDPNNWFHARIEIKENTITVYVNDDKVPSLTVQKLNDHKDGNIGVWVGNGSGGEFANLEIVGKNK